MRQARKDKEEGLMKRNSYLMKRNMPSKALSVKVRVDLS